MDVQGNKNEDSNEEVPQDNVPAQAAGDANPEADPERVDPGAAGLVSMEDPRDNTNADGQSTDAANDPHVYADGQAQALSEEDDEGSDASYEHEDDAPAAATQEEQQPQPPTGGLTPTEGDVAPVIGAKEPAQGRPPPTQAVIDAETRRLEAIRRHKAETEAEKRRLDEISRKDQVEARQIHFDQMLEALKFIRKMHELVFDPSKRAAIISTGKIGWAKQRLTEELKNFYGNYETFLQSADTQERRQRAQKLRSDAVLHANEILDKLNEVQAQVDTDVEASLSEQDESRASDTTERRGFRTSSPNQRAAEARQGD
ncbi:unnamed protein product [Sphagnum tenellum]